MKKVLLLTLMLLLAFSFPSLSFAKVVTTETHITESPLPSPTVQTPDSGIKDTNVQKLWKQGYTGKGVKIAVLDTGIDYKHPDLIKSIGGGVSFIPNENWYDQLGHGTHVAGIIAAQNNKIGSIGVAYDAKIYAVKVMNKNGVGSIDELIAGVKWSIEHHMNIINMSLALTPDDIGTPSFRVLRWEIHRAYLNNILIVASSGNDGASQVSYPANFPDVIAVGGTWQNYSQKWHETIEGIMDFSNYSSKIEVVAPSDFVYSTYPMSKTPFWNDYKGYEFLTGTSMASPYVSGFLADLKQAHPNYTNIQLRNLLHKNTIWIYPMYKAGYGFLYAR